MALLKKNKSENDLRNTCLTQLEVFLNTETKQFVNVLFNVLNTKSYLPKVVATPFAISTEMQPGSSNNQESIKRDRSRSPGSPAVNSNSRNRHSTNPESSNKRNRSKTPEPFSNSLQEARNDLKRSKNDGNDSKENASRFKKRCRDYEEKGYCMRGDTCLFDHGVDPVVLDPNNVGSVLALSSSIAEPYNPESPELDTSTGSVRTVSSQNSFTPSPVTLYNNPKQVPPPQPPVYWPSNPSLVNQRPNHYRDNANFSKVSSHHKNLHVNPHVNRPNFSQSNNNSNFTPRPPYRPNGPDFGEENRNGFTHRSQTSTINASAASFRPSARRSQPTVTSTASNSQSDYMSRCSLEVRRIPAAQNTISNLNDHFKRFGTIVNIQLSLDSNPEASLVQFSNHQEAFNAYRSTEAVLNNRFIRVYWHNPSVTPANASSMPDTANSVSETRSITKETVQSDFNQPKDVSSKLNDKSIDDESAPNQLADVFAATQKAAYNPGLLKKQYNATPVVVPDIPKPAPPKSTPVDSIMVMKETLLKQLEVQTKRKGIIDSLVRDQTILIDKMNKCTNEKERFGIESILKSLKAKIQSLEDDFKKNTQDILSQANQPRSKAQLSKEIMDLENELHVKIMKGESVIDIHKKLSELKVQVFAIKKHIAAFLCDF